MKKRFVSILVVLCLCLILLPTTAMAADPIAITQEYDGILRLGDDEWQKSTTSGCYELSTGNYRLGGHITILDGIIITGDVTLDLNGHILESDDAITIDVPNAGGSSLTLNDSGTRGCIVNNGVFVFKNGYDFGNGSAQDYIKNLALTGTGYVHVEDNTSSTYYANSGTELKYIDSLSTDNTGLIDEDGYKWEKNSETAYTLTLKNVYIKELKLNRKVNFTIKIDGTAIVDKIMTENDVYGTSITIEGVNNGGIDQFYGNGVIELNNCGMTINNLQVEHGHINLTDGVVSVCFKDATVILNGGISYPDNFGSNMPDGYKGLELCNTHLTMKDGYYRGYDNTLGQYVTLFSGKITMDDDSILTLDGVYIDNYGNVADGFDGLYDFLPDGYEIIATYNEHGICQRVSIYKNTDCTNPTKDLVLELQMFENKVPFTVEVKKGGDIAPDGGRLFELEAFSENATTSALTNTTGSVYISGIGSKDDNFSITDRRSVIKNLFWKTTTNTNDGDTPITNVDPIGIYIRQKTQVDADGWTFADELYYISPATQEVISPIEEPNADSSSTVQYEEINPDEDAIFTIGGSNIYLYKVEVEIVDKTYKIAKAELVKKMTFTNIYTKSGSEPTVDYTVIFDVNGGDALSPSTASATAANGHKLTSLPTPTRSGYDFVGWFTAAAGGDAVTLDRIYTADTTIYAHWTFTGGVVDYTVIFDVNGGDALSPSTASATAANGHKLTSLPTPTRGGYDFVGWFTVATGGDAVTLDRIYTADTTIYARWTFTGGDGGGFGTGVDTGIGGDNDGITSNVPPGLNGDDHIAYIMGYPDGCVHPNDPTTRAEAAAILYRLLTDEHRSVIETDVHSFTDIPETAWYRRAVATLANGGYIGGYSETTFGGDDNITRAQFVAMLARFIELEQVECNFSDLEQSHWAYVYIANAAKAGWVAGDGEICFRSDDEITRAEAMTILNRVLDRGVNADSELLTFKVWSDNLPGAWYYYEVIEATNGHDYTGKRPSENWTALR